jgi:tetraacyldisaccharide 4'-kinase
VITRKDAAEETVRDLRESLRKIAPAVPQAVLRLEMTGLLTASADEASASLSAMIDKGVLAVSAIGNPHAFAAQLRRVGAVVSMRAFPDHHVFSGRDAARIAGESRGLDMVVCTLKDAVKLGPIWPADAPPLWYVSQSVQVESGGAIIDDLLSRLALHKLSTKT